MYKKSLIFWIVLILSTQTVYSQTGGKEDSLKISSSELIEFLKYEVKANGYDSIVVVADSIETSLNECKEDNYKVEKKLSRSRKGAFAAWLSGIGFAVMGFIVGLLV